MMLYLMPNDALREEKDDAHEPFGGYPLCNRSETKDP